MNCNVQKVSIIGDTGAGKTCFIAALRWMGEAIGSYPFRNVPANGDTKKYLDGLFENFNKGDLPSGTDKATNLAFEIAYTREKETTFNFHVTDFKGGDLGEVDENSLLYQLWAESDVLLVLFDVEKVKCKADFIANLKNLCNALMRPGMRPKEKYLALILTQADKESCFTADSHSEETAKSFMETHLSTFSKQLDGVGFKGWKCFALSSLGVKPVKEEGGLMHLPIDLVTKEPIISPFGYTEIFDWLVGIKGSIARKHLNRRAKPFYKPLLITILSLILLGGAVLLWLQYSWNQAKTMATSPNSTLQEKAKATWNMEETDRINEIENQIEEFEQALQDAESDQEIKQIILSKNKYWELAKLSEEQRTRVEELINNSKDQIETNIVNLMQEALDKNDYDHAKDLLKQYDTDIFIRRFMEKDVKTNRDDIRKHEQGRKKYEIATFDVGGINNTERMKEKISKIRLFDYENKAEEKDAKYACDVMLKLLDTQEFKIIKVHVGTLKSKRDIYVKIATGVQSGSDLKENDNCIKTDIKDNGIEFQWDEGEIHNTTLSWKPGTIIRVEMRRDGWGDNVYAHYECDISDWLGLLRLLKPRQQMISSNENFEGGPWMTIKCSEFQKPEKDLELIEKYIHPGTYWKQGE